MHVLVSLALLAAEGLQTLEGKPFSFEELADKPAVLVFWNSWVPQDPRFVSVVRELEQRLAAAGFSGAVVIFQEEDPRRVAAAVGKGPWPRVVDRRGVLLRRFGVTRAPLVLVLAPGGQVQQEAGPDPASVRQLVDSLTPR